MYLGDVWLPQEGLRGKNERTLCVRQSQEFFKSQWFTRGWTCVLAEAKLSLRPRHMLTFRPVSIRLQELIAPKVVEFRDGNGNYLGNKDELAKEIFEITGIDIDVLRHNRKLSTISVAARMSWAAMRSTSREEDQAYCLLGIFDVNMPLLYGEGQRAFWRLQEAIIEQSTVVDHSILAWTPWESKQVRYGFPRIGRSLAQTLLSPSPRGFRHCRDIISWSLPQLDAFELLPRGLRLSLRIGPGEFFHTTQ